MKAARNLSDEQDTSSKGGIGVQGGFLNSYEAILIPAASFAANRGLAPSPEVFVLTRDQRIGRITFRLPRTGPNLAVYPY